MNKDEATKILGLNSDYTEDDLKKAFRKKAMQYHPDKNNGDDNLEKYKKQGHQGGPNPTADYVYEVNKRVMEYMKRMLLRIEISDFIFKRKMLLMSPVVVVGTILIIVLKWNFIYEIILYAAIYVAHKRFVNKLVIKMAAKKFGKEVYNDYKQTTK